MSVTNKHIVQKMCFETQVDTEETAIVFADKLRTIDCESLLSKALLNYNDVPHTIKIDSLTIDAGDIDVDDFDKLEEEIIRQLKNVLEKNFSADVIRGNNFLNQSPGLQTEADTIQSHIDLIIFYLLNGSLPWNVTDRPDIKNLLFEVASKEPFKLKQSLSVALTNIAAAKRLALLFEVDEMVMFAENILAEKLSAIAKIINILLEQVSPLQAEELKKDLLSTYVHSIHESIVNSSYLQNVFISLLQPLLNKYPLAFLESVWLKISKIEAGVAATNGKLLYEIFSKEINKIIREKQSSATEISVEEKYSDDQPKLFAREKVKDDEQISYQDEEEASESGEKYFYVNNAGLVLLNAALLQKYFEEFEWVKNKKIVDEHSMHKIILWTDFVVWGERKVYEYDLMLNKILAGIHPADVCDINISLFEIEKLAAIEFLKTIIENWSILKNTSIDGFRTSFLQRKGKLSNEDGGWQLHVESKGYDILIDSLPWSFSIIKFPWMQKPLFTQWQTKI